MNGSAPEEAEVSTTLPETELGEPAEEAPEETTQSRLPTAQPQALEEAVVATEPLTDVLEETEQTEL
jgi:hypothetical protein